MRSKIAPFLGKSIYRNALECYVALKAHINARPVDKYRVLAYRLLLRFLEANDLPESYGDELRRHLKSKKSNPDLYVPSNEEVLDTLSKLKKNNQILFCLYLVSGLRKIEGDYIIKNLDTLKVQEYENFVKINISTYRNTKSAFFCYLPKWLYTLVREHRSMLSIRSLDNYTTDHKGLVPAKYARKWFYTKCIELGVPESIADFYEGRISGSIGTNHYLGKQSLADKYYGQTLAPHFAMFDKIAGGWHES